MTPASAPSTQANRTGASLRYAWYVVIVLTGLYMLSFVDRTILSMLVGSIKRDLGIKDMGRLLPGHGGLMDRLDGVLPSAVAAWTIFTLLP